MKKTVICSVLMVASVAALVTGCGVTSPDMSMDFPFYFLQDVSTASAPVHCCYLGPGHDGVAASDSLYFLDYRYGYCLARVDLQGYTVEDLCATSDGGYAAVLCGNLLFYVSDGTYVVHEPVTLGSYGSLLLAPPPKGSLHLYSLGSGGIVTTVNTQSWDVVSVDTIPGLSKPVAAAISSDGTAMFIADGDDDTVKKISTGNPGTVLAECHVPGGISCMCGGHGNLVYASLDSLDQVWGIDVGTGKHYSTLQAPGRAVSMAVTPDEKYIYVAGGNGGGLTVVNLREGDVEVSTDSYGVVADVAINGSGDRALLCSNLDKIITLQK